MLNVVLILSHACMATITSWVAPTGRGLLIDQWAKSYCESPTVGHATKMEEPQTVLPYCAPSVCTCHADALKHHVHIATHWAAVYTFLITPMLLCLGKKEKVDYLNVHTYVVSLRFICAY